MQKWLLRPQWFKGTLWRHNLKQMVIMISFLQVNFEDSRAIVPAKKTSTTSNHNTHTWQWGATLSKVKAKHGTLKEFRTWNTIWWQFWLVIINSQFSTQIQFFVLKPPVNFNCPKNASPVVVLTILFSWFELQFSFKINFIWLWHKSNPIWKGSCR